MTVLLDSGAVGRVQYAVPLSTLFTFHIEEEQCLAA